MGRVRGHIYEWPASQGPMDLLNPSGTPRERDIWEGGMPMDILDIPGEMCGGTLQCSSALVLFPLHEIILRFVI